MNEENLVEYQEKIDRTSKKRFLIKLFSKKFGWKICFASDAVEENLRLRMIMLTARTVALPSTMHTHL